MPTGEVEMNARQDNTSRAGRRTPQWSWSIVAFVVASLFALAPARMVAAGDGDLVAVKGCVEDGTPVDTKDDNGYTPLAAAVSYGHHHITKWLLENGADPNMSDIDGKVKLMTLRRE